jgi:hypothetical protein
VFPVRYGLKLYMLYILYIKFCNGDTKVLKYAISSWHNNQLSSVNMLHEHQLYKVTKKRATILSVYRVYSMSTDNIFILIREV